MFLLGAICGPPTNFFFAIVAVQTIYYAHQSAAGNNLEEM
jgi:hypothetical protein